MMPLPSFRSLAFYDWTLPDFILDYPLNVHKEGVITGGQIRYQWDQFPGCDRLYEF